MPAHLALRRAHINTKLDSIGLDPDAVRVGVTHVIPDGM